MICDHLIFISVVLNWGSVTTPPENISKSRGHESLCWKVWSLSLPINTRHGVFVIDYSFLSNCNWLNWPKMTCNCNWCDPWSSILQLNTDGLTADKIYIIEQLAYKNKAFIIVLQETHCAIADKLVIPNFSLARSVLSRNHGLATFVHERMEWSLVDQSPEPSKTEWLCVDIAEYKIINVYKPPHLHRTPMAIPTFPHPSLYAGDFNCQHVN